MHATAPERQLASATGLLAPYAITMIVANVIAQGAIVAAGSEIDLLAIVLTAGVALGYAGFLIRNGRHLAKVRFGLLAAHVMTYTAVTGGYLLHFFILATLNSPVVQGPDAADGAVFVMDPGWFGVAIGMPTFWGLGLLVHALGAILGRGFEARR